MHVQKDFVRRIAQISGSAYGIAEHVKNDDYIDDVDVEEEEKVQNNDDED